LNVYIGPMLLKLSAISTVMIRRFPLCVSYTLHKLDAFLMTSAVIMIPRPPV